ncbi:uncharacterized protein METZ01_LOCUS393463, partial [marine metagenome]
SVRFQLKSKGFIKLKTQKIRIK